MRTIETILYNFDELSETAKQTAISKLWDLNVDHEWWDGICDDASQIGLKISGFDIDRGSYVNGSLNDCMIDTIELIKANHGQTCETYKLAERYENDFLKLDEESDDYNDEVEYLENEFLKELCDEYLTILRNEYEYLTSEDSIIEAILANEYEFDVNGNLQ